MSRWFALALFVVIAGNVPAEAGFWVEGKAARLNDGGGLDIAPGRCTTICESKGTKARMFNGGAVCKGQLDNKLWIGVNQCVWRDWLFCWCGVRGGFAKTYSCLCE
ncbi:MAG TPA: hypothetical protein VH913_10415 [Hyphomicrobiaceae bacterium]|jgi:hypothetical protein